MKRWQFILSSSLVLSFAFVQPGRAAVWQEPTCDPTVDPASCNVAVPLNVSSSGQIKEGSLTVNSLITATRGFSLTGGSLVLPNDSVTDAMVSNNPLTASIFRGGGSHTDAVDLDSGEVAGILSNSSINDLWVNTTGDGMTGTLTMLGAIDINNTGGHGIFVEVQSSYEGINVSSLTTSTASLIVLDSNGTSNGSNAINVTGSSPAPLVFLKPSGTNSGNQALSISLEGTSTAKAVEIVSAASNLDSYPLEVKATGGSTRAISAENGASGGYALYGVAANGIGVGGSGNQYGIYGASLTSMSGVGVYGDGNLAGVHGVSESGRGVVGTSTSGYGGWFETDNTGMYSADALHVKNTDGTGGNGISVLAGANTGIDVDVDDFGTALETHGGAIHNTGSYLGGQFYPNENAGNGVMPNVAPNNSSMVYLPSDYTTNGLAYDGSQVWISQNTPYASGGVLENINIENHQISNTTITGIAEGTAPVYAPGYPDTNHDNIYVFSTTSARYFAVDKQDGTMISGTLTVNPTTGFPRIAVYNGQSIYIGTTQAILEYSDAGDIFTRVSGTGEISDIIYANGYIWAADNTNGIVHKVQTSSPYSDTQITVRSRPSALVYDGTYVWVANFGVDSLSRIDSNNNSVITYDISSAGVGPRDLVYDGANIWFGLQSGGIGYFNIADEAIGLKDDTISGAVGHIVFDGTSIWAIRNNEFLVRIHAGTGFGNGVAPIKRGMLMYNTSGYVYCGYINSGGDWTVESTLTNCQ